MINIGEKIKNLRIQNKLTQIELADKLFLSDKTISSWESSRTMPDINMLIELCKVFNISIINFLEDINDKNIEIEFKVRMNEKDFNILKEKVKNNSKFIKEEVQNAVYFKPNDKSFENEWLRVRNENNFYILNYKRKDDYSNIEEYEVKLDDNKNITTILKYLGFDEYIKVNKHRETYIYNDKYEFSFDKVENLGLFVEIEVSKYEYDSKVEIDNLIDLMKKFEININNIETKRYPELMEKFYNKNY